MAITFAEQPVRLARDTGMYSAGRGAVLYPDDLLASGAGTVLIAAGGATVALGPRSAIFIGQDELVLLAGWLKVNGRAAQTLLLTTAGLQFDSAGVTATLHATPGATELFAESAGVRVLALPADATAQRTSLPREHFGVRSGAQPLKVAARPTAAFLAAMPRTFLDPLVPVAARSPAAPRRERAATFTELAPLLAGQPALRRQFQARLAPPRPPRPPRAAVQPASSSSNLF
jgi:hypothetical protein